MDKGESARSGGETVQLKRGATLHRWLLVLVVVFVIISLVFMGLFVYYYILYEDEVSGDADICLTRRCLKFAESILNDLDQEIDPCDDFYQYACGSFISRNKETKDNAFLLIEKALRSTVIDILSSDSRYYDEPEYLKTMKNVFSWCLVNSRENGTGNLIIDTKDWPTVNENWTEESFDLNSLLVKGAQEFICTLFDIDKRFYPVGGKNGTILLNPKLTYTRYTDLAEQQGADEERARKDALGVEELRTNLSNIISDTEFQLNRSLVYKQMTLREMSRSFTYFNITLALVTAFNKAGVSLEPDREIYLKNYLFFYKMENVLKSAPKRVIQNYFLAVYVKEQRFDWNYIWKRPESDNSLSEFHKMLAVVDDDYSTSKCLALSVKHFKVGIFKEIMTRSDFSFNEAKEEITTMKDEVKEAMKEILSENTWLSQTGKNDVLEKLDKMSSSLILPEVILRDEELNKMYEPYKKTNNESIEGYIMRLQRLTTIDTFQSVDGPLRVLKFAFLPNAFYSPLANYIEIPSSLLYPPVYHPNFTTPMKFGAIGFILGHEISHGFDVGGIQFDQDGRLRSWLPREDSENFHHRSQCLIDQYSAFNVKFSEGVVYANGTRSQGENLADKNGVKTSYLAYKKHVEAYGEGLRLPGLELNNDQLFFLSLARTVCSGAEETPNDLTHNFYALDRYRVIGSFQNINQFATAFQCPVGSTMNPRDKCSVWD